MRNFLFLLSTDRRSPASIPSRLHTACQITTVLNNTAELTHYSNQIGIIYKINSHTDEQNFQLQAHNDNTVTLLE
jgi:hypothetical protein